MVFGAASSGMQVQVPSGGDTALLGGISDVVQGWKAVSGQAEGGERELREKRNIPNKTAPVTSGRCFCWVGFVLQQTGGILSYQE